jgi:hypothetical protein
MGDAGNISPRIPSACAQNAILSLLIIHIILRRQIYVAIDNPSFIPSVSCITTRSYLSNAVRTANNISHAESCKATAAGAFLTCTNFETESKLHEFSGIEMSARANQY